MGGESAETENVMGYRIISTIEVDGPIDGDLDLRGTGITALPEGLTVGGNLDLEGCTGITALPASIRPEQVIR